MTVFPEESLKPLGPELEQGMLYLQGERKEKQPTWGDHRQGYWFHWAEPSDPALGGGVHMCSWDPGPPGGGMLVPLGNTSIMAPVDP